MVERLHTSGSAYSLPGLLAGTNGQHRRSRAFSIESASMYSCISLENDGDIADYSPGRYSSAAPARAMTHRHQSSMSQDESAAFLPAGATLYRSHSLRDNHASNTYTHVSTPSGDSDSFKFDTSSSDHDVHGLDRRSDSTHATTPVRCQSRDTQTFADLPSRVQATTPSRIFGPPFSSRPTTPPIDPFCPEFKPLESPVIRPTLLQRRTTDPFGYKHSLRVINPDARYTSKSSLRPSLVSSRATTPTSILTTNDEFVYDDKRPRTPLPVHLDLPQRTGSFTTDRGSVYTPTQVSDVGFFRGD